MTQLLEQAFQKISIELTEEKQNSFAQLMLNNDSHVLLNEATWLFRRGEDYSLKTQQAMLDVIEGQNLTEYQSSEELFHSLGI